MSTQYNEGWDAYMNGSKLKDNRYQPGSDAYLQWELGWLEAQDDEASEAY